MTGGQEPLSGLRPVTKNTAALSLYDAATDTADPVPGTVPNPRG
jgi:hypothetical protein